MRTGTNQQGFTLLELLVSVIVASIVVTGLLSLMVELLRVDRRELALDQTQRDMQRALDYIVDDIREAVYVYSTPTTVTSQITDPPAGTTEPILAFWRPDVIDNFPTNCAGFPTTGDNKRDECEVLQLRQAAYSLVVYYQVENDGSNPNWLGESRIVRYELPKYSNLTNLTTSTGYSDPTVPGSNFASWVRDGLTTDGSGSVLVDFVDAPDGTTFSRAPLSDSGGPCQDFGTDYRVSPPTATTTADNSFFACVRSPLASAGADGNSSQDVYLFLRGNALSGRSGVLSAFSDDSALPTLETRVLVRGVTEKNPAL